MVTLVTDDTISQLDSIIKFAHQHSASDIHIEPSQTHYRIRYRQDGFLYEMTRLSHDAALRLITRLKVMAKLDIGERRLPQDGRLDIYSLSIRVSTCPTSLGEKIVLRIFDAKTMLMDIHKLGLNTTQQEIFIEKISQPQGLILVTGPTGSGKTVTLYSVLQYLNQIEKNIVTIEDPIEISIEGINQVNVNPKIGLCFATVLRTFLRQDPDIIMVGEIRDAESADIALQAAETGHLVLSTLHANSAAETLTRLKSMNLSHHQLTSSINLIIAQRLVRKLCSHCKIFSENYYQPSACNSCKNGYHGRIGIYELLPLSNTRQEKIMSLQQAGLEKVNLGITSMQEINRVIPHEIIS